MLRYRLITGPLLIALILGVVWLDSWLEHQTLTGGWRTIADAVGWLQPTPPRGLVLFVLSLGLVPMMAREGAGMMRASGIAANAPLAMVAASAAFVVVSILPAVPSPLLASALAGTLLVGLLVVGMVAFSRGQQVRGVMAATGGLLLVAIYSGVLLAFWMLLRQEHSAWLLVGAILTTKSCDIGAYFTGVSVGRHKLIPWLSPGKTWEGLVGGIVTATLVGTGLALLSHRLPAPADQLPWWLGAIGGAIVAVVGQFGDLAESLFKRDAGLKDSGQLLPGMGGVLDVLDSPLMTGPAVFWLLALASRSTPLASA